MARVPGNGSGHKWVGQRWRAGKAAYFFSNTSFATSAPVIAAGQPA